MAGVAWSRYPVVSADPQGRSWLAYVAITRGMRRVTITHCAFCRGYATPSCFLDDIPDANKVNGWLASGPASGSHTGWAQTGQRGHRLPPRRVVSA